MFSQRLDTAEVFKKLPLKSADLKIRVLISSSYTSEQRRLTLKPYEIRKDRVYALFCWFKTHHPSLYGAMEFDVDAFNALPRDGYIPELIETAESVPVGVAVGVTQPVASDRVLSDSSGGVVSATIGPVLSVAAAAASMSDGVAAAVGRENGNVAGPVLRTQAPGAVPGVVGTDPLDNAVTMSQSILVPRPNLTYRSTAVRLRMLISDSKSNGRGSDLTNAPGSTVGVVAGGGGVSPASVSGSASSSAAGAAVDGGESSMSASASSLAAGADAKKSPSRDDTATYDVISSSEPYWITDKPWLSKTFINLFPFGRGGLDEVRLVKISAASCIEHYQRLSTRQFQRPEFVLHCYDMLARMKIGSDTFLKARMNIQHASESKDFTNSFGMISVDTLLAAANHISSKAAASVAGRVQPLPPAGMDARGMQILTTIQQVAGACEHTPEYAARMRARIFGYSGYLGPATWWYVRDRSSWRWLMSCSSVVSDVYCSGQVDDIYRRRDVRKSPRISSWCTTHGAAVDRHSVQDAGRTPRRGSVKL